MNKSELIESMAQQIQIEHINAKDIINTIVDAMFETLSNGDGIEIRGFGTFKIKEYKGYTGLNPKTGDKVKVKAKKSTVFKLGKELFEKMNGIK